MSVGESSLAEYFLAYLGALIQQLKIFYTNTKYCYIDNILVNFFL